MPNFFPPPPSLILCSRFYPKKLSVPPPPDAFRTGFVFRFLLKSPFSYFQRHYSPSPCSLDPTNLCPPPRTFLFLLGFSFLMKVHPSAFLVSFLLIFPFLSHQFFNHILHLKRFCPPSVFSCLFFFFFLSYFPS